MEQLIEEAIESLTYVVIIMWSCISVSIGLAGMNISLSIRKNKGN